MQTSQNPWTGEILGQYAQLDDVSIGKRLERARLAQQQWPTNVTIYQRTDVVIKLAEILREKKHDLARLITQEMGKLYRESLAEIEKCAYLCDVYAEQGAQWLEPEPLPSRLRKSLLLPQPLGVILLVMPWNFPFWQVIRAAVPAILAGNAVMLKHASNVPQCALALEGCFLEAGYADGLFQTLLIPSSRIDALIRHPTIRGISLTGSESAGRAVARTAGEMLKKVVLELGGSDPLIVLEDADLTLALDTAVASRFINGGQSCIAAKRLIIDRYHYDDFVHQLEQKIRALKVGDPMDDTTDIPPMARPDLRDELHQQVTQSLSQGAKLNCGGAMVEESLASYYPTLLSDVNPSMTAFNEETFGPVAVAVKSSDIPHALSLANASRFGLGSTIFTSDGTTAMTFAENLRTGCTAINSMMRSDPLLPFGGVGDSGMGREMGRMGLLEFTNVKTVYQI